ncbi:cardiolipin synthase [Tyzzerella sp. OttesenSCG-928-J15]|nr:cardiolipin synthase [Tyzzerella sp. OttesenSCG-928-J15]
MTLSPHKNGAACVGGIHCVYPDWHLAGCTLCILEVCMISNISFGMGLVLVLDILFAAIIVFFERKNPGVTWAWLMVILFLPYVGFVLYLVCGLDGNKYNTFMRKSKMDRDILTAYSQTEFNINRVTALEEKYSVDDNILEIPGSEHYNDLVFLNYSAGFGFLTTNNDVKIFHEGNSKFASMIEDIRGAEKFIHLQYYIMRNDNLARTLISELAKKAAEGVEVKLLLDGMGCLFNPKSLYKPLTDAGGYLGIFLPPNFVRINYRNHRKICVVDGKCGYIGGLNIGDEYLGKSKRFGHWRDAHIRICGDSVKDLELRFIMDWNYCFPREEVELDEKYFPPIEDNRGTKIQIVSSGPDTKWPSIRDGYIKMITEADKSIYIQTPYFVPDDSIFETLKIAALSGIDVRIMIPANPDHPFVYWAALSYLGELINSGVKCYQYKKGFVHSKLVMIDGIITSIGTANVDIRSFKLNFEINAFLYDVEKSAEFERKFLEDIKDCTAIDHEFYANRSNLTKVKESVSRLISPLL